MINKLIIDDKQIELTEKDKFPYTYSFSTAKAHKVRFAIDDTNEICAESFKNCTYLTKITFPSQISMIKRRAFENCSRLNNLIIPDTIKYIGANVFDGCSSLDNVTFEGNVPPENYAEFPNNCTCFIPNDSKYIKATYLDKDNVQYYSKTWYNQYNPVNGKDLPNELSETDEYYYDNWVSIVPNDQSIELKNKKPIDNIEFEINQITGNIGDLLTITYTVSPTDTTNPAVYFQNTRETLMEIVDTTKPGEILVQLNNSGRGEILAYAESGAWAKVQITSMGSGGVEAPTEKPTEAPTEAPTEKPTEKPTEGPTEGPTEDPGHWFDPTEKPTEGPGDSSSDSSLDSSTN